MLQFKHLLVLGAMLMTALVSGVDAAYGHGVSAMRYGEDWSCSPLTIIKSCGKTVPTLQSYYEVTTALVIIAVLLLVTTFAFRGYLQSRDFYVVKYRG